MPSQPPSSHDTSWQLPLATPRLELRAGTLTFPAPAHCIEDNAPGLKLVLVLGGQLDYQLQSGGAVNVEGPAFHISLSDTPFSVSHRYAARQALQYLSARMPMQALHDTFGAELEALARRIAPATRQAMATANGRAGKTLQALASATQDIATDGLLAERFEGPALGRANALQVGGTMVGFFTGGSGVLMLSGMFDQRVALLALAVISAASLALVVLWRETALTATQALPAARQASLRGFIRRPGAPALLGIAFCRR